MVLEMPLPQDSEVLVTNGFIQDKAGNLSRQIDCIVVRGEAKAIKFTSREVVPLDNAILAVEVKKRLYSTEAADMLGVALLQHQSVDSAR